MKKLILAAGFTVAAFALSATVASANPRTFTFENETWVIATEGGPGVSANHMTPGFGKVCPKRVLKLEARSPTTGGRKMAMTAEQRFRGDARWHVVCFWEAPDSLVQFTRNQTR